MMHRPLAALALAPATLLPFIGLLQFIGGTQLAAQNGPNQQQPPFKNELLDNLVGLWSFVAGAGGHPIGGGADVTWELGHQWLRLHQKEINGPEAVTYIGYDTHDHRLVAIRLDNISARGAETNGYGLQDGNSIVFTFDYATTQFRQTYAWDPQTKTWQFLVESRPHRATTWTPMSTLTLRRVGGRGFPPGPRPQFPVAPAPAAPQAPQPPQ
jgi:hypothetical protein